MSEHVMDELDFGTYKIGYWPIEDCSVLLRSIVDPPPGLYYRRRPDVDAATLLDGAAVAIVGARACSGYGASVAHSLGVAFGKAGLPVVSGLARGIDTEAHKGALDGEGVTVAVLGCGIDHDYPAANALLAQRIVLEGGLIVSEYGRGVPPAPWRFPARNRIISALSVATVVVEARTASGALHTADYAIEQHRKVFAVPGEITSALSVGTNELLRRGHAALCSEAAHVLDYIDFVKPDRI